MAGRWFASLAVCLLLTPLGTALAQFAGQVGFEQSWTDNVFLVDDREPDWISRPTIDLEWGLPGGVTPYYRGDGYLYAEHTDLHVYVHRLGLSWDREFGERGDSLILDGSYRGSLHGSDAGDQDYHEGDLRLDLRFRPRSTVLIGPDVSASIRSFPRADDLSFVEAGTGLFVNGSFATGTTLRGSAHIDYKRFLQDIPTDDATDDQTSAKANGGPGPGGPDSDSPGPGGADSDMGAGSRNSDNAMTGRGASGNGAVEAVGNEQTVDAAQAVFRLRLAQGFPPRVGGYVEGWYRVNLLDPPRYAEGAIPAVDREIFDDRYAYEGPGVTIRVTVLLPKGVQLSVDGTGEWRRYADRPALDAVGLPVSPADDRDDQRAEGVVGVSYERAFDRVFPAWIGLGLDLGALRNASNDVYYDTREFWGAARIAIGW